MQASKTTECEALAEFPTNGVLHAARHVLKQHVRSKEYLQCVLLTCADSHLLSSLRRNKAKDPKRLEELALVHLRKEPMAQRKLREKWATARSA